MEKIYDDHVTFLARTVTTDALKTLADQRGVEPSAIYRAALDDYARIHTDRHIPDDPSQTSQPPSLRTLHRRRAAGQFVSARDLAAARERARARRSTDELSA